MQQRRLEADSPSGTYEWDVFISYNKREKPWVRRVVSQWRSFGLKVFFDEDSSLPGEPVIKSLAHGIESSRYVVCMLSSAAAESDWVSLELVLSLMDDPAAKSRRLIPVLLEDLPDSEIKWIRHLNCVSLWDPEIQNQEYQRLLRSLRVPQHAQAILPPIGASEERKNASNSPAYLPLNPRYTFDRFVVGYNNEFATAAAHAVAEAPAKHYNPLFIYGGVGLGKTHLMYAIGHRMLERDAGKRVMYISSERFTNELVSAIQEGSMAEFRRQYRQIDLLLVDDIQFLEGKERAQEEFFHTFNVLHDAQRQIVLTSDRPPKDTGLEDRLVSRFEWGLVTEIKPPDFETRMAILWRKVEEDRVTIYDAEDVLTFIARNRTGSVRELEGAIIKLFAYSSVTGRPIDLAFAREALGVSRSGSLTADGSAEFNPELVLARVATAWGTTPEALQSQKRTKDLTVPRQVAMYLIRQLLDLPLMEIGRLFGGRDHTTMIHSINKVEAEMAVDSKFRQRVEEIRRNLS